MRKHLFLTTGTMLLLIGTAGLLRAIAGPPRPHPEPAGADALFAIWAAHAAMAEVELSDLARMQSGSAALKAAAGTMQADHEQAAHELRTLAAGKRIALPAALDPAHLVAREHLAAMDGPEFDRAWLDQMIRAHEAAIALFTTHARTGADAELRSFAAAQLPALRAHLTEAQRLVRAGAGGRRARR